MSDDFRGADFYNADDLPGQARESDHWKKYWQDNQGMIISDDVSIGGWRSLGETRK